MRFCKDITGNNNRKNKCATSNSLTGSSVPLMHNSQGILILVMDDVKQIAFMIYEAELGTIALIENFFLHLNNFSRD